MRRRVFLILAGLIILSGGLFFNFYVKGKLGIQAVTPQPAYLYQEPAYRFQQPTNFENKAALTYTDVQNQPKAIESNTVTVLLNVLARINPPSAAPAAPATAD